MFINKVFLYGNLTRDPELKALPSGMNVCNISIATNRSFTGKDGQKQEQTEFHSIVAFGRQADTVARYMKKGFPVFVEGRLQTRSWDKDGQKHYRTEIVADSIQFGPRGAGSAGGAPTSPGSHSPTAEEPDFAASAGGSPIEYPKDDINPDDIPF